MPTVVIPFAGVEGKTRLHTSRRARRALSLAMLGDVLSAATAVGDARVVTADSEAQELAAELGASSVADPGGGQGAAVAAALAELDLRALLAATPAGGVALVEALDGTTNALSLSAPEVFAPLYGRDSAARFRAHIAGL